MLITEIFLKPILIWVVNLKSCYTFAWTRFLLNFIINLMWGIKTLYLLHSDFSISTNILVWNKNYIMKYSFVKVFLCRTKLSHGRKVYSYSLCFVSKCLTLNQWVCNILILSWDRTPWTTFSCPGIFTYFHPIICCNMFHKYFVYVKRVQIHSQLFWELYLQIGLQLANWFYWVISE